MVPLAAPAGVRRLDHARSPAGGRGLPSLPVGTEVEGIRSLDGTPLYVDYCGEGDTTVFFVHGWTCKGAIFHYQKAHLYDRYRVVTLDLRGHGRSGMPAGGDFSTERLAEDLKAVVDHFAPSEFVVAGHSMGGFTAFKFHERFGTEYGARLKGMAIIDSTGTDLVEGMVFGRLADLFYPVPLGTALQVLGKENLLARRVVEAFGKTSHAYMLVRWAAFGKKPPAEEVESQREMTFSTPVPSIALAAKACFDYHVEYHLPKVDLPVLLVVGSEDKLTNVKVNRRTCSLLPRARLVVYDGAGHCSFLERTGEFNRELEGFLAHCFAARNPEG